jgi:ribosome-associated translation inhibitor RaiA
MITPLEISFHGLERSEAVEARIREKFDRLQSHFDRITHARVVIDAPQRRTPLPKRFVVRIEIGIPGHAPVVASYDPPDDQPHHTDVMLAIRDAFAAATRQIDELADRLGHSAKKHERVRRRPRPSDEIEA